MKGKFVAILFLFSLTAPIASTFIFLQIQKSKIKKEVKRKMIAKIDKDKLVLLKFTEESKKKELSWENPKEFKYKGEMYDIVSSKKVNDTTYYWCWWDHEETKLNKQLEDVVSFILRTNKTGEKNQANLEQFLKTLFFIKNIEKKHNGYVKIKHTFSFPKNSYQNPFFIPKVPPPKILLNT